MAEVDQIQQFTATIPAGTPASAPVVVQMQLGVWDVTWVEIETSPGFNGAVGFYLASSLQQVIPFRKGTTPNWLVYNGQSKHWDLHNQPNSGDWQLVGYNIGNFDHTVYVAFGLVLIAAPVPSVTPAPVNLSALSGST